MALLVITKQVVVTAVAPAVRMDQVLFALMELVGFSLYITNYLPYFVTLINIIMMNNDRLLPLFDL